MVNAIKLVQNKGITMSLLNFKKSDLKNICASNNEKIENLIKAYETYISYFEQIPLKHNWVFNSNISLLKKWRNYYECKNSVFKINKSYWSDVRESIMAAEFLFYYRSSALANSSLQSLINKDYLTAAIITRSLLELCMWHVYHSIIFDNFIKDIPENTQSNLIDAPDIQEMILKLIWGTNEKNISNEVKQHKVIKILKQVDEGSKKRKNNINLEKNYDFLSEFTHPNVAGNNIFFDSDINACSKPIETINLILSAQQNDKKKASVANYCCDTVNWCFISSIFASQKYRSVNNHLLNKFK